MKMAELKKVDLIDIIFFIQVENTVGIGEINPYKQFLLFPLCFQKTNTAEM